MPWDRKRKPNNSAEDQLSGKKKNLICQRKRKYMEYAGCIEKKVIDLKLIYFKDILAMNG